MSRGAARADDVRVNQVAVDDTRSPPRLRMPRQDRARARHHGQQFGGRGDVLCRNPGDMARQKTIKRWHLRRRQRMKFLQGLREVPQPCRILQIGSAPRCALQEFGDEGNGPGGLLREYGWRDRRSRRPRGAMPHACDPHQDPRCRGRAPAPRKPPDRFGPGNVALDVPPARGWTTRWRPPQHRAPAPRLPASRRGRAFMRQPAPRRCTAAARCATRIGARR